MSLHGKIQPVENCRLHKAQPVPQVYWMWAGARHARRGAFCRGTYYRRCALLSHKHPSLRKKLGSPSSSALNHVCMYVCTCVRTWDCVRAYVYIRECARVYKCACLCTYVYTCESVCVCVCGKGEVGSRHSEVRGTIWRHFNESVFGEPSCHNTHLDGSLFWT